MVKIVTDSCVCIQGGRECKGWIFRPNPRSNRLRNEAIPKGMFATKPPQLDVDKSSKKDHSPINRPSNTLTEIFFKNSRVRPPFYKKIA